MAIYAHKQTRRIRNSTGNVLCLPEDIHGALSREMTAYGYETMWNTALAAMRHGLRVMQLQRNRADQIYNEIGNASIGSSAASNGK